ncbi:MAG: choice-of-anchor D domain-containing protein [Roseivirga sp.]|nr:choice-of-anchor D domain-containing protein [Roseivirga sp.]
MVLIFCSTFSVSAQRASTFGSPQTLNGAASAFTRIADLDDTRVIAIYKLGVGASLDLYARVGTVNQTDKTIAWGTTQLVEAAGNLSVGVVGISSTTAVVYYEDTDSDQVVARVLTINSSTDAISNVGSVNVYANDIDLADNHIQQQAMRLTNTTFAIGYVDNENSDRGTVKIGEISGTSISFGAANVFSTTTDVNNPSMSALSPTRLVFSWEDDPNGDVGKVRVGEVDGTTVNFGTEVSFTTTAVRYTAVAGISETQFVVAYEDDASTSPADPGSAYVGTVAGTSITLSSSNYQFETLQDVADLTIDGTQGNEFIIGWNSGVSADVKYIIGEVSGTGTSASISYEAQKTILAGSEGDDSWVSGVGNNAAVMSYSDDQDADHAEVVVASLTPEVPTPRFATLGGLSPFLDALTTQVRSTRLSDDKVLIIYSTTTSSTTNKIMAIVGTVSGSTMTYGTAVEVTDFVFTGTDVIALSSTKAAVFFENNLDTDINRYVILDIDGDAITANAEGVLGDGHQVSFRNSMKATALNSNQVVVAYERDSGADSLYVVAGTVSGSTITWGSSKRVALNTSYVDITRLSNSKFALVYEGNDGTANGAEGLAVIGELSGNEITLGSSVSFASTIQVDVTLVTALSETEIVVAYELNTTKDFGEIRYGTVSGTSVSFPGNATSYYPHYGVNDIELGALSGSEFLLVIDGSSMHPGYYYTGTLSGNDIALRRAEQFIAGQPDDVTVSALTSDLLTLVYTDDNGLSGTTDRGEGLVLSLKATSNPEINVQGNSVSIESGDITATTTDHTDFGTGAALSRTFTIQNQGTGTLTLGSNAVSITGTNASEFSVNTQPSTSVSGNGTTTFIINFASSVASTRSAEVHIASDDIHEPDYVFNIEAIGAVSAPSSATVAATVYIEGAYNGTDLNTTLNASIPTTQPYTTNGHAGAETAGSIPAGAVDWVLVELREAASAATALSSTKVGSAAGFLMNDGSIRATNGTSDLTVSLSGNTGSDFFVVVYHRNHLGIMSASAISESGGTYSIDFTTSSANTYQTTTALTTLSTGKFAMPAGDADGDGDVDATDLTTWRGENGKAFSYATNGKNDLNLDGAINAIDRNDFQKKNNTKSSQVPTT